MLDSTRIQKRQSEVRQKLAELAAVEEMTDETRSKIDALDREYQDNERRFRAALIAEDEERREAKDDLETRSDREWSDMMANFEVRQIALALDEGRALTGQTREIVEELRSHGGFQGMPLPLDALEVRNTVASGVPDPIRTAPIIDRLFPDSVAAKMGGSLVNVGVGQLEYPVTSSSISAGWAASEGADVPGPTQYTTVDRPLTPDHNLGITMSISRKSLKQAGPGLESAVRRDMAGAVQSEMDKAVFLGSGASGQPTGIFAGASGWSITETDISAAADWSAFRSAAIRFITGNAATGPKDVRLMVRPEIWGGMDAAIFDTGSGITEWDRLTEELGSVVMTANCLAAPAGGPPVESSALMTTTAGGVAPFYVGVWGALDLVRDPYTDARSGGLRLTALATMDVTISRAAQLEILTGLQ